VRDVGRNDQCPCGSGRKHKRCCLDVERAALRIGVDAERRILDLGLRARREAAAEWRRAYESNLAPLSRWGTVPAEMGAWLDTWLACHAAVIEGRTPLEAFSGQPPSPVDEQLGRSAICAWWVRGTGFPLPATHWRCEEPVVLHSGREPLGVLSDGALMVARGVEAGPAHVALIGRPVVVEDTVVGEVLTLLNATPADALCAALRWPEVREHTAEGELVQHCLRSYELNDPAGVMAALRATAGVTEREDVVSYWEDDVVFKVARGSSAGVVEPAPELGVIWELCGEDSASPPLLGEITVSPEDCELTLSAPTRARADCLLTALPAQVRLALGDLKAEDIDVPDVLPRVNRERLEDLLSTGQSSRRAA
jgi:hypothetical protein